MECKLPSFRKPPLVETAVSLQFQLIEGLRNAHLAAFWQSVRDTYPKVSDAEPVLEQVELFGEKSLRTRRFPSFRIASAGGAARMQMASADDQTMVQVQNGRIIFNWRKGPAGVYPRWHKVLPRFQAALDKFTGMLASEKLEQPAFNQWEVVYVNHLLKGQDWGGASDWPALLPGLVVESSRVTAGTVESLACSLHAIMPDNRGRIHIDLFHGFSGADGIAPEILSLQIAARGGMAAMGTGPAYDGLELAHGAIVQTFCDITGREAQVRWEREV